MAKEFLYKGKTLEDLKKMDLKELGNFLPARERRVIKRGLTEPQKIFLQEFQNSKMGKRKKPLRTHCRNLMILPLLVGSQVHIYNGKEFVAVMIEPEMIGHRLGEFALTRKKVNHNAPGIGATKSTSSLSVK